MRKIFFALGFAVVVMLYYLPLTLGEQLQGAKFKHADKNKDGAVDTKEWNMEKKWEHEQKSKVNTPWEKKADTDRDGIVEKSESRSWEIEKTKRLDSNNDGVIDDKEKRLGWKTAHSRVNTSVEAKYDKDGDGWLNASEAREMLQDKYRLIQTNGKAKVDTALESGYDANNDGIIDADEAKNLKQDLSGD